MEGRASQRRTRRRCNFRAEQKREREHRQLEVAWDYVKEMLVSRSCAARYGPREERSMLKLRRHRSECWFVMMKESVRSKKGEREQRQDRSEKDVRKKGQRGWHRHQAREKGLGVKDLKGGQTWVLVPTCPARVLVEVVERPTYAQRDRWSVKEMFALRRAGELVMMMARRTEMTNRPIDLVCQDLWSTHQFRDLYRRRMVSQGRREALVGVDLEVRRRRSNEGNLIRRVRVPVRDVLWEKPMCNVASGVRLSSVHVPKRKSPITLIARDWAAAQTRRVRV